MKICVKHGLMILALGLAALPVFAEQAPPWLEGDCVSLGIDDQGMWTYQLTISWDTGKHGVSHVDVIIDDSGNCSAAEIGSGLFFASPAGHGEGVPGACSVEYNAVVEDSDPSINLMAVVLKYEPRSSNGCEPGRTGGATYEFRSPYPPAAIDVEHLALIQKFSHHSSYGTLRGVFPGLPCNPVAAETSAWGELKASYR